MSEWSIRVDWLLPGNAAAIRDAVLRVHDGRVAAMGPAGTVATSQRHRVATGMAMLPGLINAHAHLELGHLEGLLPRGVSLPEWLDELVRRRGSLEAMCAAVRDGAARLLAGGTTCVADVSHANLAWPALAGSPLRRLCLAEALGRGMSARGGWLRFCRSLEGLPRADGRQWFGVSPHAPYSTAPAIFRQAARLANERGWPIGTHLAETTDEREFLRHGLGPLADWARRRGLIPPCFRGQADGPIEFLKKARFFVKNAPILLIHCHDVTDGEIECIARAAASVVFCPGCAEFFNRPGHRYADMLSTGVNVALGTDGLSSNDGLDMLAEMRRLRRQGLVNNTTILRMATTNGATAIGRRDLGRLAPDCPADFILVPVGTTCDDPLEAILTSDVRVAETVIGGETVFTV
ncbi:MAG: amidohydrolase family protein [Phycisphaerae bacterium]|nr:amidohydrolase family protein [Phycisphaerae bacterium]